MCLSSAHCPPPAPPGFLLTREYNYILCLCVSLCVCVTACVPVLCAHCPPHAPPGFLLTRECNYILCVCVTVCVTACVPVLCAHCLPPAPPGFLLTREYDYMLRDILHDLYERLLTCESTPVRMRCQVLRNLLAYLTEEETRMIKADQQCEYPPAARGRHCGRQLLLFFTARLNTCV